MPTPTSTPIPTQSLTPILLPSFAQLSAPSRDVVWTLVAGMRLFRSADQGATWQERSLPSQVANAMIAFAGYDEGWIAALGSPATQCQQQSVALWHTRNGAATWSLVSTTGVAAPQCKDALVFADDLHGFLDAWDPNTPPLIYETHDGGRSWDASQPLPDPPGFSTATGGFTLRPGRVKVFGNALLVEATRQSGRQQKSFVFKSTDGGATWHDYTSDYQQTAPIAPDLVFADPFVDYATVRGTIKRTVDGGAHWVSITTPGSSSIAPEAWPI